jgi:LuxR family glucitol operon transcriptional activator
MTYAASRLTLFAVISAIEEDLRSIIRIFLATCGSPKDILGERVWDTAVARLSREQGGRNEKASLAELIPYIDFADAYTIINGNARSLPGKIAEYLKQETHRFDLLAPIRNRVMHARPLNYDDFPRTLEYADQFIRTTQVPWSNLNETLQKLKKEPSYVLGLVIPVSDVETGREFHNLPTPDFDETGFLGRERQVQELIKLCLGTYPVITIFGEGGVGKTALALKVAYDLLESSESPFDAIVWTTAKAARLTAQEVVHIEGAIEDSLGLFRDVASHLAGTKVAEPMDEVIGYLSQFKILLVLDNLETVLDARIRTFLEKLPAGSKVLVTSRIGMGAFDFPYKLQALTPDESVQLLRAVATIRGTEGILKMPNKKISNYCDRMKHNPGFIKWFVSAVQVGKRPEEVLAKPHVFLDFCMTNVYQHLDDRSRIVLRAMLTVPGKQSQPELAFLTQLEGTLLQRSLQHLITTNFVVMTSKPYGSSFETRYSIADLAGSFLIKHYPPSSKESAEVVKRKRQLIAAGEKVQAEQSRNPYSYQSITTRSPGDLLIARYLLDALNKSAAGHIADADKALAKARELAPDFFEVFRVEALVRYRDNNLASARDAYETAIALEPESAPLRLWYASFVARYFDDLETALEHLHKGHGIDPESEEIQLEMARILVYRSDFTEAGKIMKGLSARLSSCNEWFRRKHSDLSLTFHQRRADALAEERDWRGALEELLSLRKYFESISATSVDDKMRYRITKALPTVETCIAHLDDLQLRAQAHEILGWITHTSGSGFESKWAPKGSDRGLTPSEVAHGSIQAIKSGFGFIAGPGGTSFFFHRSSLSRRIEWAQLKIGSKVSFGKRVDDKGRPFATDVVIEEE